MPSLPFKGNSKTFPEGWEFFSFLQTSVRIFKNVIEYDFALVLFYRYYFLENSEMIQRELCTNWCIWKNIHWNYFITVDNNWTANKLKNIYRYVIQKTYMLDTIFKAYNFKILKSKYKSTIDLRWSEHV